MNLSGRYHIYFIQQVLCSIFLCVLLREHGIIIIIKRISRAPIYHTRWQHMALYNNTKHTHIHTHTQMSDEGMGRAVKNSLEIIIKQVRLEGGFERGGRIIVAECLRQIVPDRPQSTYLTCTHTLPCAIPVLGTITLVCLGQG